MHAAFSGVRGTSIEPPHGARTVAWYYREPEGEVLGPSVIETLCTLWRCGELTEATFVRPEGSSRFVRVRDAPALLLMLQGQAGASQPPTPFLGVADYGAGRAAEAAPASASDWCGRRHAGPRWSRV